MYIHQTIVSDITASGGHLATLLDTGAWFIQLMYAIIMIVSLIALIVNITRLGMSGGNPMARSQAIRNILIAGGCLAVLGGLGIIFFLLLSFF